MHYAWVNSFRYRKCTTAETFVIGKNTEVHKHSRLANGEPIQRLYFESLSFSSQARRNVLQVTSMDTDVVGGSLNSV